MHYEKGDVEGAAAGDHLYPDSTGNRTGSGELHELNNN